jgi:dihydrodipicolinate synthase/N-acetylneuraminate lyase
VDNPAKSETRENPMITASDLKGIMAMMPAFTTKDGDRPDAEDTVNTTELARAVDQILRDGGANVITTSGSFGEFHTLLWEEHKKLIEATVAVVKKRVPVFIGCTNLNPREAIRQARFAQAAGATVCSWACLSTIKRRWTTPCNSTMTSPMPFPRWA